MNTVVASVAVPAALLDNAESQVRDFTGLMQVSGIAIAIVIALMVWLKVKTAGAVITALLVGGVVNWGINSMGFMKNEVGEQLESAPAVVQVVPNPPGLNL